MTDFYRRFLDHTDGRRRTVVDLGSQDINGTYRPIFDPEKWHYIGVDMVSGPNVDVVVKDPYRWEEFATDSVDCVVSGQAFEHIEFFWLTMGEIARILKPGSLCCILAPSGGPEHRYPVDCWRFYPDGMAALARYVNLTCVETTAGWDEPFSTDLGHLWCDTTLIAQKPNPEAPA